MNVLDATKKRRSIRQYQKGDIPAEVLRELLEAARIAPSWKNQQCFTYVLVKDRDLISKLGEITDYNPSHSAYENATYFLVLCADPTQSGARDGKAYYMTDAAISLQQMMLVAADHGLGMCWIGAFMESPIKHLLKIPEDLRVVGLSPIGIPAEAPNMRPRRPLNEVFFLDEYGKQL